MCISIYNETFVYIYKKLYTVSFIQGGNQNQMSEGLSFLNFITRNERSTFDISGDTCKLIYTYMFNFSQFNVICRNMIKAQIIVDLTEGYIPKQVIF